MYPWTCLLRAHTAQIAVPTVSATVSDWSSLTLDAQPTLHHLRQRRYRPHERQAVVLSESRPIRTNPLWSVLWPWALSEPRKVTGRLRHVNLTRDCCPAFRHWRHLASDHLIERCHYRGRSMNCARRSPTVCRSWRDLSDRRAPEQSPKL